MERCISFAPRELIAGLVSKHPSVSAPVNSRNTVINRTKTGQLPLLQSKPKAGRLVSTLKPPPPKVEERSIPKLKPKSKVPPTPEQNEDDCSNAKDSQGQDDYCHLMHTHTEIRYVVEDKTVTSHTVFWKEPRPQKKPVRKNFTGYWECTFCGFKNNPYNKHCGGTGHLGCKALPEEPESKIQWEMGRGLKRESSFEEPERKFRGKEQQQEPMEAATAPKLHLYQEVLIFSGDGLKI